MGTIMNLPPCAQTVPMLCFLSERQTLIFPRNNRHQVKVGLPHLRTPPAFDSSTSRAGVVIRPRCNRRSASVPWLSSETAPQESLKFMRYNLILPSH
jgi:hypothetical protein